MKRSFIKIIKLTLPLLLGVFLIGYSYNITTPSDRVKIIDSIKDANYFWVFLSLIMGVLSHVSRAIRWNLMLEPMGYRPKFWNNFMAILAGYLANLGIPRSGEVLRATTISGYERIPFEKTFGTVVAERVIDLVMLLLIVILAALFQTEFIIDYFTQKNISIVNITIAGVIALITGVLFLLIIRRSKLPFFIRIRHFLSGLLEGLLSIFKMKKKGLFIFHTFMIWVLYIGMFYIIKFSIPETAHLGFSAIIVGFVAGAFAMSATNGGIGVYPLAVAKTLSLYGVSNAAGDAFGWIMWSSQTFMVIIFGGLAFIILPIFNKSK